MAQKNSQKKKEGKKSAPNTLEQVLNDFNKAWEYTQSSWHERWTDNYKLYNNNRVKVGYKGITDTFVPMTFSTIETMTSALFGTKPKFDYLPPKEKPDQKTDILNALLDFYWDKDQWSVKVINTGRTGLIIGTGIDFFYWDVDHPCMINVPTRDYFRDPTTPGDVEPRYQGRRFLTSKEELESFEIVDPETGEMRPKYKDLNKIQEGSKGDNTDKQEKEMFYGSLVDDKDQIEVIEYWTKERVISVANRSVIIQDDENPFLAKAKANKVENPEGLVPFNWFRDYVDPSLFYAKGEVDFMADQQELLNDITNQNIDSITFTLNQMYTLDPKYSHLLNEIENLPGATYLVESGALQPIQQRPIPGDAFNERMNIKNEIRETTGSNEVVKGVGQDSTSTATEINAQIAGAGQRLGLKVTQIENEYFHRMARIVLELIKLYVTEPMMVRIVGRDGAKWEEFDPSDFQDDYEPRVQLDITIENKKREDAQSAKEMLAAFLNDPDINQQELKKLALSRSFDLDPDEVELLVQPGIGVPPEMGGMPPETGAIPPELPPEGALPPEMADPMMQPPVESLEPVVDEAGQVVDPATGEVKGIMDPETGEIMLLEEMAV